MTSALGSLLERNLLEVFGQRDSASRAVVIAEIYTADCTFYETEERIVGRDDIAVFLQPLGDCAFRDRFADFGHFHFNGHGITSSMRTNFLEGNRRWNDCKGATK